MRKLYKNNKGFTLIEMLIVLMIISVLIILIVPTLSNSSKDINDKGCRALVSVVQAQINLFQLEEEKLPANLSELVSKKYITDEQKKCSNNAELNYSNGTVSLPTGFNE